jgi:hypothetical protein
MAITNNSVSADFPAADYEKVMEAMATIRELMPFLIKLSEKERSTLPKLGDKSRAFVDKALDVAIQTPDFLPRGFSIEEMERAVKLFAELNEVQMAMMQLLELINDTVTAVGSDAYNAALSVYGHAKMNKEAYALDNVIQELSQRFAHRNRPKKQPTEKQATGT